MSKRGAGHLSKYEQISARRASHPYQPENRSGDADPPYRDADVVSSLHIHNHRLETVTHFKFNDLNELLRAQRLDARMQQHGIEASDRKRLIQMNPLERIRVARTDSEVRVAVLAARAERALDEIGLRPQRVKQIMAGVVKMSVNDVDQAISEQAKKLSEETNEKKRISTNKYKLDAHETMSVEAALDLLFPIHKRVQLKNELLAAGLID
jgi:hypothetical protein